MPVFLSSICVFHDGHGTLLSPPHHDQEPPALTGLCAHSITSGTGLINSEHLQKAWRTYQLGS